MVSGLIGAVASGVFVDRTEKFKLCLILELAIVVGSISSMAYALTIGNLDLFVWLALILGFGAVGYVPISLAFGVEMTFPLQPVTVNGSMLMLAQGSGFALSLIITFITDEYDLEPGQTLEEHLADRQLNSVMSMLTAAFCIFIALVITCFIKEDLRRLKFMNKGKTSDVENDQ